MPSSEDMIEAQIQVRKWAIQQLVKEGHTQLSAETIAFHMCKDVLLAKAEKWLGRQIYTGPYSSFGG
jgi:hypothetical protein